MIEPERQRLAEELFHAALLVPANERAAFLRDACPDVALREEVESLLAFESSANQFIEKPALAVAAELLAEDHFDGRNILQGLVGGKLGRYSVLEKLGGGGMGVVYKAEDTRLRRTVALKFLPLGLVPDPHMLERFQREAHSASALNHPNICTVYDIGEFDGQPFIAMEFLDGETLEHRIDGKPLPIPELITISLQIGDALQAAHARGVIHRDIKPSNIFVTTRRQAKVLDFGLAKLQEAESPEVRHKNDDVLAGDPSVASLRLTCTGAAMGTAGYMSPEQVRGEKLDARTDLFSFGLVLYEMATGQRAFAGDTGPEIQKAIISQTPRSARELNSRVPARLQTIIQRALEKDREKRYQSAVDLRNDIRALQQQLDPARRLRKPLVAGAAGLILMIVATSLWYAQRHSQPMSTAPEIRLRQLTANTIENRVLSGAISPDGAYLVYSDFKGIHLKDLRTGKTLPVAPPAEFANKEVVWETNAPGWFPDSRKFLVTAHPAAQALNDGLYDSRGSSIWTFSVPDGKWTRLRDQAAAWSVSPDGTLISFVTKPNPQRVGDREIWVMDPEGGAAKKLFEADDDKSLSGLYWSPDTRQVLYALFDGKKDNWVIRDLHSGASRAVFSPAELERGDINELVWLPDGRLIYSAQETGFEDRCNFWAIKLQLPTGERVTGPTRMTNWGRFCVGYFTLTRDGKQMAFLESTPWNGTLNVADVAADKTGIFNSRRFLLDEYSAVPQDWAHDSKTVIFTSYQEGSVTIYKQRLDEDSPTAIFTGAKEFRFARVSPDKKWVLGFMTPKSDDSSPSEQLVRIPFSGGPAEFVLSPRPLSAISCSRPPAKFCVIAEMTGDQKEVSIQLLDPIKGRGREIERFNADSPDYLDCVVSNDGTRVAVNLGSKGPIHMVPLRGGPTRTIPTRFTNIRQISWAPDGKGLYVGDGGKEWYLGPRGDLTKLWENPLGETRGMVSPDGRHVAIFNLTRGGNMWMMENF